MLGNKTRVSNTANVAKYKLLDEFLMDGRIMTNNVVKLPKIPNKATPEPMIDKRTNLAVISSCFDTILHGSLTRGLVPLSDGKSMARLTIDSSDEPIGFRKVINGFERF